MHIFYVPGATGDIVTLPDTEAQHALRVLRLRAGDPIEIADGAGHIWSAQIEQADAKRCTARLLHKVPILPPHRMPVRLAIAPTKNIDRMEWLVEKATEIGCDDFYFLLCKHSERKELKLERLEKVAINAMKQSKQAFLPRLHTMQPFASFIKEADPATTRIAHLSKEEGQSTLTEELAKQHVSTVVIGPEGDFSAEELKLAAEHQIQTVKLVHSRLRTETAALAACFTLNIFAQ